MSLENKAALITGGAQGIGLAVARRFLDEGARVVIADKDEEAGGEAISTLGELGAVRFIHCDVGDRLSVRNLVAATIDAFGQIDILVNNAGIVHAAAFLDLAEEDFDKVIQTNLKGAFLVGQAVAKRMVKQIADGGDLGTIINISSINAIVAIADQVPYCVSKGGVSQLTRVMALALAPHGIRVNAIGPGSIQTAMLMNVVEDEEARRLVLSRTPAGRIGEASEIAAVAAFLASDDASYITGQTIYADGGRLVLNYTMPGEGED
ncbi:MAG: SDR family oxidoreductase [Hyphomicrobiales bacterium]|nr:SDR family oxidoreductase [Hyphomicrobiales bacterium]